MNTTPPSSPSLRPTPSTGTPHSTEAVRELVGEFLAEKKRETREAEAQQAPKRKRPVFTAVLIALCGVMWILPSVLTTPEPPPSPDRVDATARMTIFLAAQRVFAYQRTNGALPTSLAAVGADTTGLTYWPSTKTRFEILTTANDERIVFKSDMNQATFLKSTFQVLGAAP